MPLIPRPKPATNLAECFDHLSLGELFRGATFLERTLKGWSASPTRDYYIGKSGYLFGHSESEYTGLPHPSHYIQGWHQEKIDADIVRAVANGSIGSGAGYRGGRWRA